jgi:hypothetical protein
MSRKSRKVEPPEFVFMVVVYDLSLRGLIPTKEPGQTNATGSAQQIEDVAK